MRTHYLGCFIAVFILILVMSQERLAMSRQFSGYECFGYLEKYPQDEFHRCGVAVLIRNIATL